MTSDLQIKNPQVDVEIDRDKALALGVTAQQIEDALYTAFGSRWISTIYAPNNEYRVIWSCCRSTSGTRRTSSLLYVRAADGQPGPARVRGAL